MKRLNFKNRISLEIEGYNIERCLNLLCQKGVEIKEVKKQNVKNAKIEVNSHEYKKVSQFLRGKNIKIISKTNLGMAWLGNKIKERKGLLIGMFIALCLAVFANAFVWNINVYGNETRTDNEIRSILEENGVGIFDLLTNKSNEEIEKIILDNMSEISMVSVIKKGTTIIVNLKEKMLNDEYENLGESGALIATNNGIITEINLVQGTLLVKVGDIVRAGDELVAPYIIDSSGTQIPIEPKANITADIWLSGESIHYCIKNTVERTGNYLKTRAITFLGQNIFSDTSEIPYDSYETETRTTLLSESLLPIRYTETIYYETVSIVIEQAFSEVEEQKINEAKQLAYMCVNSNDKIKSGNYVISEYNGKTTVSYSITVNRKIS